MQNHFGEKIKGMATIFLILDIIAALICGGVLIANEEEAIGIVVIILGIVLSLPFYYLMSGFGQIVENTDIIAHHYENVNLREDKIAERKEEARIIKETKNVSSKLSDANIESETGIELTCPSCKEQLYFTKEDIIKQTYLVCPYCEAQIPTSKFTHR